MIEIAETLVREWWDLLLLVALPGLLSVLVTGFYQALRVRLDEVMRDDLPQPTGDWVRGQLARMGIRDVEVIAIPEDRSQIDAFLPDAHLIQLSEETFFKRDPSFWAIGAHEMGHALTYRRSLVLASLLKVGRGFAKLFTTAGAAFALANVLYGVPLVNDLAHGLLLAGAVLTGAVVIDELIASHQGHRLLREGADLTTRQTRAAWLSMGAGLGTYLASFVGKVVLVALFPAIAARIVASPLWERGFPPTPSEAATWAALSFLLFLAGGAELRRLVKPRPYDSIEQAARIEGASVLLRTVWEVALLWLMFATWNQHRDPAWIAVFLLAAVPAVQALSRFLSVLASILLMPVFVLLTPLFLLAARVVAPGGPTLDEEPVRGEKGELEKGREEVRKAALASLNDPPLVHRILQVQRIAFLPMVLMYWSR